VMLDEFTWGQVRRISPEAPVPVVEVTRETDRLGGSANVAANIRALGGIPLPISVIGNDRAAERILSLCKELEIDSSLLLVDERRTTIKTRIIAHDQQVVRADREDPRPLSQEINQALATEFLRVLEASDAVIVSDYDKGVVNKDLLEVVLPAAARAKIPVFLDPKVQHADYYKPTTLLTPNQGEAELLSRKQIHDTSSLEKVGRWLLEWFECPYLIITRGKEGLSLFEWERVHHLPAAAREVYDVSGAGDTVIATVALASASGAPIDEAAFLANRAAGIVVGKIGTATVSPAELVGLSDE
jgi:rfaE bifunctional protein kinase chain/domain